MYDQHIIGTCSRCGGPVSVPNIWGGVIPPVPTCQNCGAVKRTKYGPVIDMEDPVKVKLNTTAKDRS